MAAQVSVLMPTYGQAAFLGRAVASLLAQTLTDWELVVVDDGSPDATAAADEGQVLCTLDAVCLHLARLAGVDNQQARARHATAGQPRHAEPSQEPETHRWPWLTPRGRPVRGPAHRRGEEPALTTSL